MTAETCIIAIDPGLKGALAVYFPSAPERVAVEDLPVVGGEIDGSALARRVAQFGPTLAMVERVGPMPRDGVRQAFQFGAAYSAAKTVIALAGVPMHLVTPQAWKKALGLKGGPEGKEQARLMAIQLFPASAERFARKLDHGRAEAALLAKFAGDGLHVRAGVGGAQ